MHVLEIFVGVLEIFSGCPGDICCVTWRYLMIVLEIFDGYAEDI